MILMLLLIALWLLTFGVYIAAWHIAITKEDNNDEL